MTAPTELLDPSVYVSYFFVLPGEFEKPALTQPELERLLTEAVGEVAGAAPPERVRLEAGPAWLSRRLAGVPRQLRGDGETEAEVRTLHDSVVLRVGVLRTGQFPLGPGAVVPAPALESLKVEASNFLGKLTLHAAEAAPATSDADLLTLAEQYAGACLPGRAGERHRFSLPVGGLVVGPWGEGPREGDGARMVFVYRQGERVEFALQITLQELFLGHLKARNVDRNLRAHHLRQAKEQDHRLRDLIAATQDPDRLRVRQLQKANDELTTIRANLVTSICAIENELRTLEVARENFARALRGSPFEPEAGRLTDLFIDRYAVPLRNQALVDLGYRKATRERATVHFESLGATIDLQDAKQTHLLALVMAALTCAQVAALVAVVGGNDFANWPWWWRLLSVLAVIAGLFGLSWFLIKRR